MSKGQATRSAILDEAVAFASVAGLDGLSIGGLAQRMNLSKSGLFAHFGSKEALQQAVMEEAFERFEQEVIRPAIAEPRGLPRVRALFRRWLRWGESGLPGGCLLLSASVELDDQPGPLRDFVAAKQASWMAFLERLALITRQAGDFRPDLDTRLFAFQALGIVMSYNLFHRLLGDKAAAGLAEAAFEQLIAQHSVRG
ncbi:MAG TPA: TetR/AcrR family transcriptional regulator [Alphaproteobacteria bacterium]|nr:TetR/AcrR family transcriptional regulator [Alphaproteobacteria bacterium]